METVKPRKGSGGIRRAFVLYVLVTLVLVVALSGAVIRACVAVQNYILPDSDLVYLTIQRSDAQGNETTITVPMPLDDVLKEIPSMISMEDIEGDILSAEQDVKYAVTKVENSFSALSPRRQFVYRASRAAMVAVPLMISLIGILLCGFLFYRKKLKPPITLLSCAAKQIGEQNLDFRISYHSGDEMEMLCDSFEQMRQTVQENNRKLWDMIEERRRLQSSVAHDLRNPIAILQGYAQYLQIQLSAEEPISNEKDGDKMNREKISAIVSNLLQTAQRLERYTDSLRTFSRLEELEAQPQPVDFTALSSEMEEDLRFIVAEKNLTLEWETPRIEKELQIDTKILYRLLENLISNAVRFAEKKIKVSFTFRQGILTGTVADDGPGFSPKVLSCRDGYGRVDGGDENHLGIGLAICRILCRKHGGRLVLSNSEQGGAVVKFFLAV